MGKSHYSHFLAAKLFFSTFRLSAVFSISFALSGSQFPMEVNKGDRGSERGGLEARKPAVTMEGGRSMCN